MTRTTDDFVVQLVYPSQHVYNEQTFIAPPSLVVNELRDKGEAVVEGGMQTQTSANSFRVRGCTRWWAHVCSR